MEAGDLQSSGLGHVPALDGLRGVAVAGVVAHHLGYLEGGFLGVDLFFVLSGFLITSLVLHEWSSTGGIRLGHFWVRRGRRLLPALFVVLAAVSLYAVLGADTGELSRIRRDGFATLLYVQNWHEIVAGTDYWDQFQLPSPLQHMWSLAIEEQFYLLWPLVLVAVLTRAPRRRGRPSEDAVDGRQRRIGRLFAICVALTGASALAMVVLHRPGQDVNRVYFGTDTRAAAVLIGAALASGFARWGRPRGRRAGVLLQVAGVAAAMALAFAWVRANGADPLLYEGGFLLCGLGVALVIAAVTTSGTGILARGFALPPLRWLGLISYGLYLWHWPVIVWLTPGRTGLDGLPLAAVRLAVGLGLSLASYHLVEQPIRRGAVPAGRLRIIGPTAFAACACLLFASTYRIGPPADTELAAAPSAADADLGRIRVVDGRVAAKRPGSRRILLVGDSGAIAISDGLSTVAAEHDTDVVGRGITGCAIGDTVVPERLDSGTLQKEWPACTTALDSWSVHLDVVDPDVVVLIEGKATDLEVEIDGEWHDACDPAYRDWYLETYTAALRILTSTGLPVVVATTPYNNAPFQDHPVATTDCRNAVVARAVDAVPGTGLVDLGGWICGDDGKCVTEKDGVELRHDGVHFSGDGAVYTARWLVPQVLGRLPG
jgi:peptidoglycan/LPS O-acetylase OafA/YrhL